MKKNIIISFLLIVAGIALLSYYGPWWLPSIWIMIIAFIMRLNIKEGLLTGGISFALVWIVMARNMSVQDSHEIIAKTGVLLGELSPLILMLLVVVVSFITGALSGWFASAMGLYVREK